MATQRQSMLPPDSMRSDESVSRIAPTDQNPFDTDIPAYNPNADNSEHSDLVNVNDIDTNVHSYDNNYNSDNNNNSQYNHSNNNNNNAVTLSFRTLTGQLLPLNVNDITKHTVYSIKQLMEQQHHIPATYQRYIFSGKELVDTDYINTYGIQDDSIIHILLRQNNNNNPNNSNNDNQAQSPPPVGAPIAIPVPLPAAQPLNNTTQWFQHTYQYGRIVKLFAAIDIIVMFIYSFYFWPFAIGIPFSIAGYLGVQRVNNTLVYSYMLWLATVIGIYIYYIVAYFTAITCILLVVTLLIQAYIITLIYRYTKYVAMLTDYEKQEMYYTLQPSARPVEQV